ncbi:MAG: hypothetical protein QOH73_2249, partial [Gaiellaceae bacterium]|nr:hypothetical protein [Gaiellaceae bacterium]
MKRLRSTSMIASPAVLALILLAVVWTSAASSAGT